MHPIKQLKPPPSPPILPSQHPQQQQQQQQRQQQQQERTCEKRDMEQEAKLRIYDDDEAQQQHSQNKLDCNSHVVHPSALVVRTTTIIARDGPTKVETDGIIVVVVEKEQPCTTSTITTTTAVDNISSSYDFKTLQSSSLLFRLRFYLPSLFMSLCFLFIVSTILSRQQQFTSTFTKGLSRDASETTVLSLQHFTSYQKHNNNQMLLRSAALVPPPVPHKQLHVVQQKNDDEKRRRLQKETTDNTTPTNDDEKKVDDAVETDDQVVAEDTTDSEVGKQKAEEDKKVDEDDDKVDDYDDLVPAITVVTTLPPTTVSTYLTTIIYFDTTTESEEPTPTGTSTISPSTGLTDDPTFLPPILRTVGPLKNTSPPTMSPTTKEERQPIVTIPLADFTVIVQSTRSYWDELFETIKEKEEEQEEENDKISTITRLNIPSMIQMTSQVYLKEKLKFMNLLSITVGSYEITDRVITTTNNLMYTTISSSNEKMGNYSNITTTNDTSTTKNQSYLKKRRMLNTNDEKEAEEDTIEILTSTIVFKGNNATFRGSNTTIPTLEVAQAEQNYTLQQMLQPSRIQNENMNTNNENLFQYYDIIQNYLENRTRSTSTSNGSSSTSSGSGSALLEDLPSHLKIEKITVDVIRIKNRNPYSQDDSSIEKVDYKIQDALSIETYETMNWVSILVASTIAVVMILFFGFGLFIARSRVATHRRRRQQGIQKKNGNQARTRTRDPGNDKEDQEVSSTSFDLLSKPQPNSHDESSNSQDCSSSQMDESYNEISAHNTTVTPDVLMKNNNNNNNNNRSSRKKDKNNSLVLNNSFLYQMNNRSQHSARSKGSSVSSVSRTSKFYRDHSSYHNRNKTPNSNNNNTTTSSSFLMDDDDDDDDLDGLNYSVDDEDEDVEHSHHNRPGDLDNELDILSLSNTSRSESSGCFSPFPLGKRSPRPSGTHNNQKLQVPTYYSHPYIHHHRNPNIVEVVGGNDDQISIVSSVTSAGHVSEVIGDREKMTTQQQQPLPIRTQDGDDKECTTNPIIIPSVKKMIPKSNHKKKNRNRRFIPSFGIRKKHNQQPVDTKNGSNIPPPLLLPQEAPGTNGDMGKTCSTTNGTMKSTTPVASNNTIRNTKKQSFQYKTSLLLCGFNHHQRNSYDDEDNDQENFDHVLSSNNPSTSIQYKKVETLNPKSNPTKNQKVSSTVATTTDSHPKAGVAGIETMVSITMNPNTSANLSSSTSQSGWVSAYSSNDPNSSTDYSSSQYNNNKNDESDFWSTSPYQDHSNKNKTTYLHVPSNLHLQQQQQKNNFIGIKDNNYHLHPKKNTSDSSNTHTNTLMGKQQNSLIHVVLGSSNHDSQFVNDSGNSSSDDDNLLNISVPTPDVTLTKQKKSIRRNPHENYQQYSNTPSPIAQSLSSDISSDNNDWPKRTILTTTKATIKSASRTKKVKDLNHNNNSSKKIRKVAKYHDQSPSQQQEDYYYHDHQEEEELQKHQQKPNSSTKKLLSYRIKKKHSLQVQLKSTSCKVIDDDNDEILSPGTATTMTGTPSTIGGGSSHTPRKNKYNKNIFSLQRSSPDVSTAPTDVDLTTTTLDTTNLTTTMNDDGSSPSPKKFKPLLQAQATDFSFYFE